MMNFPVINANDIIHTHKKNKRKIEKTSKRNTQNKEKKKVK